MDRLKRGVTFFVLLLVAIVLPASAQQQPQKKQLFHAGLQSATGAGVGSAQIIVAPGGVQYMIRTFGAPNGQVTKVSLLRDDLTWGGAVVLCQNGAPVGNCTYDASGNLDIEGAIVALMFPPGVTGAAFSSTLNSGNLAILLNDGSTAVGLFVRIL